MKQLKKEPDQNNRDHIQSQWADWIDHKTESISPRTWALLLAGFVLVAIGYNTWLIWDSLTRNDKQVIQTNTELKNLEGDHHNKKVFDSVPLLSENDTTYLKN